MQWCWMVMITFSEVRKTNLGAGDVQVLISILRGGKTHRGKESYNL